MNESQTSRAYRIGRKAIEILEQAGKQARFAGGCVRDHQLGVKPKDYDVATTATPEEICTIFKQENQRVVPTGIDHGTITVVIKGIAIEVTTLRQDIETDGRHAKVQFGQSFQEDAARRDFTINALFEDKDGKVYDYYGGLEDLKNQVLRFVGEASGRIQEDYLRILRFFRFWARLQFSADKAALKAIDTHKDGLRQISRERILAELMGVLASDAPQAALNSMATLGILQIVLGDWGKTPHGWPSEDFAKDSELRRHYRLLHLLRDELTLQDLRELKGFLKMKNQSLDLIQALGLIEIEPPTPDSDRAGVMNFIDQVERLVGPQIPLKDMVQAWSCLFHEQKNLWSSIDVVEEQFRSLRLKSLPLKGDAVAEALGLEEGVALGRIMKELKRRFRNGEWESAAEGLALAPTLVD